MLPSILRRFANHLLTSEDWARSRLKPFAGRRARIDAGPLQLTLLIGADGSLLETNSADTADVCIILPADAPLRALRGPAEVFGAATLTGSADFAEALGFVVRNLRWDVEADLARLTGDVLAHRIASLVPSLIDARRDTIGRVVSGLGEYGQQESGMLVLPDAAAGFCDGVTALRDAVDRLEARIERLER